MPHSIGMSEIPTAAVVIDDRITEDPHASAATAPPSNACPDLQHEDAPTEHEDDVKLEDLFRDDDDEDDAADAQRLDTSAFIDQTNHSASAYDIVRDIFSKLADLPSADLWHLRRHALTRK